MLYHGSRAPGQSFQLLRQAFLLEDGAALAEVLPEDEIRKAFEAENVLFALAKNAVYTVSITLWGFVSQTLHPERLRSCTTAVARITALCVALGRRAPSPDTGAYCRARARLSEPAMQRLVYHVGDQLESRAPAQWLWLDRHVKMGDGTTLTVPDTDENRKEWPQARTQKPGVGFPILRMVVLLSVATAAVCGMAMGPYKGKGTGETALLRGLFERFDPGDVFLADCYFCSYFMIALLLNRHVDVVMRQHHMRHADFRTGLKLGREDHVVTWHRPSRPTWMDETTYATMPEELKVRELRVRVGIPGFRVRKMVVVTTLLDAERYSKEDLASLYRQRWHVELDIRNSQHQDQPAYGRYSGADSAHGSPGDLGPLVDLQPDPQDVGPGGVGKRKDASPAELHSGTSGNRVHVAAGHVRDASHAQRVGKISPSHCHVPPRWKSAEPYRTQGDQETPQAP